MVYGDPLFSLIQCNTQYVGKLSRYFDQVMGDFWPHQTIPVLMYLSPSPPYNPAGAHATLVFLPGTSNAPQIYLSALHSSQTASLSKGRAGLGLPLGGVYRRPR